MKNSIKINLFYNSIYQIFILILPLVTAPYISRVIGADGLGIYSYNYSIALYFVYFAMLGILNYGNRCISKVADDFKERLKVFSSIYLFQLFISSLVFIIYILYVIFFVNEFNNIAYILSIFVASSIFDVSWYYFGIQEFKKTSLKQLVIRIFTFIFIILFVKDKNDLWLYAVIMSLSYFLSNFSLWIFLIKNFSFNSLKIKDVFGHFKPCLILFIPIIATSIYRVMDKIMIGVFSTMTQVGYYENAEKIIMVSLGLLGSFSNVIMPKISNLIAIIMSLMQINYLINL